MNTYACDCCGAEIDDKARVCITARLNGEIWYEWWACGDYCKECVELLADAITRSIKLPERYDDEFRDKDARGKAEVEMIEEQRDEVDDDE